MEGSGPLPRQIRNEIHDLRSEPTIHADLANARREPTDHHRNIVGFATQTRAVCAMGR